MSQILLINGILNILICGLFFFYTNKYRCLIDRTRLIVFSSFSIYFLFIGFLKLRVAIEMNDWAFKLPYNSNTIFNITSTVTLVLISVYLYFVITYKKNKNVNSNKN